MALAGHTTRLKVSGTAAATTAEAHTFISGKTYQVTNTARRIIDPSVAWVVKDNGVTVAEANILTRDYLFGRVTFVGGYTVTGPVTGDFSYLPVATIAEVRSISFTISAELQDVTTYDSSGVKQKSAALVDASGSFEFLSNPLADTDTGTAGDQSIHSFLANSTPKLLEVTLGASFFRAWVLPEGVEVAAEVAGLVVGTSNFSLAPQRAGAGFGFGS
jgi:hypothetical protein